MSNEIVSNLSYDRDQIRDKRTLSDRVYNSHSIYELDRGRAVDNSIMLLDCPWLHY